VQEAVRGLPDDYRAAVVLCDVVGLPYEEIAESLGIPVGTVRSRIHRGRARLRDVLAVST
jgi:RNA polymerase sigma-70 factor (ECF subfamily)